MEPVRIIDRGRGPEIEGTRFTVYNLMPYYLAGDKPEQIAAWTGRTLAQVQALIQYYRGTSRGSDGGPSKNRGTHRSGQSAVGRRSLEAVTLAWPCSGPGGGNPKKAPAGG